MDEKSAADAVQVLGAATEPGDDAVLGRRSTARARTRTRSRSYSRGSVVDEIDEEDISMKIINDGYGATDQRSAREPLTEVAAGLNGGRCCSLALRCVVRGGCDGFTSSECGPQWC